MEFIHAGPAAHLSRVVKVLAPPSPQPRISWKALGNSRTAALCERQKPHSLPAASWWHWLSDCNSGRNPRFCPSLGEDFLLQLLAKWLQSKANISVAPEFCFQAFLCCCSGKNWLLCYQTFKLCYILQKWDTNQEFIFIHLDGLVLQYAMESIFHRMFSHKIN